MKLVGRKEFFCPHCQQNPVFQCSVLIFGRCSFRISSVSLPLETADVRGFTQTFYEIVPDITSIRERPIPSKAMLIHHSALILPLNWERCKQSHRRNCNHVIWASFRIILHWLIFVKYFKFYSINGNRYCSLSCMHTYLYRLPSFSLIINCKRGRAVEGFPQRWPGFEPR
jgi:hypothetical protein